MDSFLEWSELIIAVSFLVLAIATLIARVDLHWLSSAVIAAYVSLLKYSDWRRNRAVRYWRGELDRRKEQTNG